MGVGGFAPGVSQVSKILFKPHEGLVDDPSTGIDPAVAACFVHWRSLQTKSVGSERTDRMHDVEMWVSRVVVEHPISDKATCNKVGFDIVAREYNVLGKAEFDG